MFSMYMYRKQITNKIMWTIKCAMQKSNLAELNKYTNKSKNKSFKNKPSRSSHLRSKLCGILNFTGYLRARLTRRIYRVSVESDTLTEAVSYSGTECRIFINKLNKLRAASSARKQMFLWVSTS